MTGFWKRWASLLRHRQKPLPIQRRHARLTLEELEPRIMLASSLVPPGNPASQMSIVAGPAQSTAIVQPAREVIALPGFSGQTVSVRFTVTNRDAAYQNEIGIVLVDDSSGRIGGLRPEEPGYAAAALAHASRRVLFYGRPNAGDAKALQLPAQRHIIFYFVQNATADTFLARNRGNQPGKGPVVFFSIKRANPDGVKHMIEKPANIFGFEDMTGGGDRDYNDLAVSMKIGTPQGTLTPPRLTAHLSHDTARGGTTNTDGITSDPAITGTLKASRKIIRFRAGFDDTPMSQYVSLLGDRRADGSFALDRSRINQIAHGTLTDGPHVLHLIAEDEAHKTASLSLMLTLDTMAPAVTFDLAPAFDSAPVGDGQTTFETVTLRGVTEPGARVKLRTYGAVTTANASGVFRFPGVALNHGGNDFAVTATDLAGNSATASRTIALVHDECAFDDDLAGWTVTTAGGGDPGNGSVTVDNGNAVLREGNAFLVTLERTFTVPDEPSRLQFMFSGPSFDTTSVGAMKDAFEVALLDAGGAPLVFPFTPGRDAFFNISEGLSAALGAGTSIDGNTVTTDLSGLAPGSTFRLVFRLVNNDGDTDTTARISCVQIIDGAGEAPAGVARLLSAVTDRPAIDVSSLVDVSGSVTADYARTSFSEDGSIIYADVAARNAGRYDVAGPMVVAVDHLSDPAVRVRDFDGVTPAGLPYFEISNLGDDGRLTIGESSAFRRIAFFNPTGAPFSYDLVFLGQLNRAPEFTSSPDVEALAGRAYVYAAAANDPDGDALSFSLLGAPASMAIDVATGRITWSPSVADVGNHVVVVQVEDGRGGQDVQRYTLEVRDNVPNRPPVFTSSPSVDAVVSIAYVYLPTVIDEDGDPLAFTVLGPAGMTVDPDTGRLDWTPDAAQLGPQYVTLGVDDGRGGVASQTFFINVAADPANHAPVIVSDPVTRFLVEQPGTPTGDVNPTLISLTTNEVRAQTVSVRVPPATNIGSVDLLPSNIDAADVTLDVPTLRLGGTLHVDIRNQGTDLYQSAVAGTFEIVAFEDRNGNAAFDPGVDNVLAQTTFAGTLAAGATATLDLALSGIVQFRDKPIFVHVDSTNTVPETDEVNNTLGTGLDSRAPLAEDWLPVVQWYSADTGTTIQSTPAVAPLIDTNGDGLINEHDVPVVVVVSSSNPGNYFSFLTAMRGDTGQTIFNVTLNGTAALDTFAVPVVGDVDGDGRPEILVRGDNPANILWAFNNDGSLKWTSQPPSGFTVDVPVAPVLVDLDADGKSEILFGSEVLNFDGSFRWNTRLYSGATGSPYIGSARVPVDLDLDGIPEIVAGPGALDRDGQRLWDWRSRLVTSGPFLGQFIIERRGPTGTYVQQFISDKVLRDGWTTVANVDGDPFPEIIVICDGTPPNSNFDDSFPETVWVFDHDGALHSPPVGLFKEVFDEVRYNVGPPSVADFDGDGQPEIAFYIVKIPVDSVESLDDLRREFIYVFDLDGTERWHRDMGPTHTGGLNAVPGMSAFDFDADGFPELAFQDANYLTVLDGRDGSTRFRVGIINTRYQELFPSMYPVVADVDNDGGAEIISYRSQSFVTGAENRQGILVIGDANDNWVHARRNWNTWAYNPAYTGEDGSVPAHAPNSWEVQNGVRTQLSLEGVASDAAPDLSVSQVTVNPGNAPASAVVTARIGNGGSLQAGGGQRVKFYLGDPAAGGVLLGTAVTSRPLFPGEYEDVAFTWNNPTAGQLVVIVNDGVNPRVASANLSRLPNSWAEVSGVSKSSVLKVNKEAYLGIDGNSNSEWSYLTYSGGNLDPQPPYYEVHFPFPVEATSVTIQNPTATYAFLGTGTLTFSNGFTTTFALNATGNGTVTFPQQTGVTWVRLMSSAQPTGGAGLAEFIVGGSYVAPTFLSREGEGRYGNNSATLVLAVAPQVGVSPPPIVEAGPDQTVFDGDTVSLNPATFIDPAILETHTAIINWGDGPVQPGTIVEANGSGSVSASHTYAGEGTFTVTVTVRDAAGNTDSDSFIVTVLNANLRAAPVDVIASDPDVTFVNLTGPVGGIGANQLATFEVQFTGTDAPRRFDLVFHRPASGIVLGTIPVTVNSLYSYSVQAIDGDSDPITYRLVQGPAGSAIDAGTGLLTWTPNVPGTFSFIVEAADNRGGSTTQEYVLNVVAGANAEPVITSTPPERAIVFRDFSYPVTASDADGDPITFFLTSAPAGMAIDPATGVITWLPAQAQIGVHSITVGVRDNRGGQDTQTFDLEATRDLANGSPTIMSAAPLVADPGVLYRYVVAATDPESDPLRFDLPLKPAGMMIHPTTGILTWIPSALQQGEHNVIVRVRDPQGGVNLQAFVIQVREPNAPPVIVSTPPNQAVQQLPLEYYVKVQDAPGEVLTYSLDVQPPGMTIDPDTGTLRWTPTFAQVGVHSVTVAVADDRGGVTPQMFDVQVVAAAANDPPSIRSTPRTSIHLGGVYAYQVDAVDPNSDPLTYQLTSAPAGMSIDTLGFVTWEPTGFQFGPNAVTIEVRDGRSGVATQDFTIEAITAVQNHAPGINSTPPTSALLGRLFAHDVQATDADGDPLRFELLQGPRGMTIHPELGTLRWLPGVDQLGEHDIVVQVIDAQGGSESQSFQVTARSVNTSPIITSIPSTEAAVGLLSTYPVRATDRDGDALVYSLDTSPDGMTIDAVTGLVQWTPEATQLGVHDVIILVDDGLGGVATQRYAVVVTATPVNNPPVITSTPPLVATEGIAFSYQVAAVDPEGQALEFLVLNSPADVLINAGTGVVSWIPTQSQIGPITITLAARDPAGATAVQRFTVTVAENNAAPVITSNPVLSVTEGGTYRYDVQTSDADGDLLRFFLDQAPPGMELDVGSTNQNELALFGGFFGRLSFSPGAGTAGTYPVQVRVVDPRGLSAVQTFDLTVAPDNQAPRVQLTLSRTSATIGQPVTAIVSASDNLGIASVMLSVDGVPVAVDANGRATIVQSSVGAFDVVATARDAAGNTGTADTSLQITDPTVVGAPVVALTSPDNGVEITAPVDVIGTAEDPDLAFYTLSVAAVGTTSFREIARGTSSVTNGVLCRFDPTLLQNDSYILRLTATDTGGNTSSVERTLTVAGNLKLGNFTLSFTDMSVPVSGIPIQATRTYDTLQANQQSDIGFGWRLEFRDTRLRATVEKTGLENDGIFNGFRDGDRVFITLPGGKREGFTFRTQAQRFLLVNFYHPMFVPDRGVTSRLTTKDAMLRKRGDEYIDALSGLPYNPANDIFGAAYKLTTRDSIEYQINGMTGQLDAVIDRNGNALSFSDGGIISSAGPAITFERDVQGRIVALVDPMGNAVRYEYDAAGDLASVTDREGNTTRFIYRGSPAHYLEQVIDPLGRVGARTEYDGAGRLAAVMNGAGDLVQLGHDPGASRETVLDAVGNPTTFVYDGRGNVITEIDALGGLTQRTFDADGNLLTETDPLGNTTTRTYGAQGNVLSQTDALGNVTRYTYGPRNEILTITDALGNTTANTYDSRGNPLTVRDADGRIIAINTYDAKGNRLTSTDAAGNTTTFRYDASGRFTGGTNPLGVALNYTYNANGYPLSQDTTRTDGLGNVIPMSIGYTLSPSNRVTIATDPDGTSVGVSYDSLGRQSALTDRLGNAIQYERDDAGNTVAVFYPDGTVERSAYDGNQNLISSTDRQGRTTQYAYDARNRLVSTTYPDGTVSTTTYDFAGRVIARTDENGHQVTYTYDAGGRATGVTDPLGNTTTSVYDAADQLVQVIDPLGRVTMFDYDANGRRIRTVFPDGTGVSCVYDALGLKVSETDQLGNITRYEYDAMGRLVAVIDALGGTTRYAYDELGNMVAQTDANGHTARLEYDDRRHLIRRTLPLGMSEAWGYDTNGLETSHTDPTGIVASLTYDMNYRLTREQSNAGDDIRYTYSPTGQRLTITDSRGITRYTYDSRDRLARIDYPDSTFVAYGYDPAGNMTSLATLSGTTTYAYDAGNRLVQVTDPTGAVTTYIYNAAGELTRTDLPDGSVETRGYDALGRLVSVQTVDAFGTPISGYVYELSPTGQRVSVVELGGRRVDYVYNALSRLTQEIVSDIGGGTRTTTYTYDAVGNRLSRDDSTDGLTTYAYDANDRLTAETRGAAVVTYTYDAAGRLLARNGTGGLVTYQWGRDNRLMAADTDGNGSIDLRYEYDADGNRVAQTVGSIRTAFVIDVSPANAQVLEERTVDGSVVLYVYGLNRISRTDSTGTLIYHADGLGSVRVVTSAAGSVAGRYDYDAFGNLVSAPLGVTNTFQFAGEQFDPFLEQYFLRARYYDPATGRFTARDLFPAKWIAPETLNQYVYAGNDGESHRPVGPELRRSGWPIDRSVYLVDPGVCRG